MKHQTLRDLELMGVDQEEAQRAISMFVIIKPGLKIKPNGRINTSWGDKTVLGLYRTFLRLFEESKGQNELRRAEQFMDMIETGLKISKEGRIATKHGDKTGIGFYEVVRDFFEPNSGNVQA